MTAAVVGIAAGAGVEGLGFEEGPIPEGEEGEGGEGAEGEGEVIGRGSLEFEYACL